MRIVLDLQACQAANGRQGIGRSSLEFTRAFARVARDRHEVLVALNAAFPEEAQRVRSELSDVLEEGQFVAWKTPVPCGGKAGGVHEELARAIRQQFFESLGADVVHTLSVFEGFADNAVTAIAPASERSYVESATLYDLIPLVHSEIYLTDPSMNMWYRRKLEDLNRADILLSISDHSRDEGLRLLGREEAGIVNVSCGVDAAFKPASSADKVKNTLGIRGGMVMYGGGIDVRKNVERLIQAYARLPAALRETRQLAIVCRISEHHREVFSALAANSGLQEDEIVMTGFVSDEDLIALYSSCDLFVFPSWHEGFGLPPLEAMACGAPVITSAISSLPEVIGREDALFDPYDVESIKRVMQRALVDREWAAELAQHGLARAATFTWQRSASAALAAFEEAVKKRSRILDGRPDRPRLAYVSPLPPERSGISDYSVELLPALQEHYELTVITPRADSARALDGIEVRSPEWFKNNVDRFERVIYQFGNSTFHSHMFELAKRIPGVVVLHDFFLSSIVAHLAYSGESPAMWNEYLYRSHGYAALQFKRDQTDTADSIWRYPANLPVIEDAIQVIVHSQYAKGLAEQWYGPDLAHQRFDCVPQLRASIEPVTPERRRAARDALGLPADAFIVCSFGMVGPNKLSSRLLDAWFASDLDRNSDARLIFVGANQPSEYGAELDRRLTRSSGCASVTGFISDAQYLDYLLAADVAVQLRTLSRGETSRAALDCMAAGLPLIVNRNGAMNEIPQDCALLIEDEFQPAELVAALIELAVPERREKMSQAQRKHVANVLAPELVARRYCEIIEAAYSRPLDQSLEHFRKDVPAELADDELLLNAACEALAYNNPGPAPAQLLVDISELVQRDAKTGIQRVVRGLLHELFSGRLQLDGCRVEPIYAKDDGRYYYAREFSASMLDISTACADEPVNVRRGDLFLGLDLAPVHVVAAARTLTDMQLAGAKLLFVVYDVLPMQRPDCFPPEADAVFRPWMEFLARTADGIACISRQVCDDFVEAADALRVERRSGLPIWHFPLGASLKNNPERGTVERAEIVSLLSSTSPIILMVGTVEPRKGHAMALDAMERLWARELDATLVIVGKQGWMVEKLAARLDTHPQRGRQLHWLIGVTDDELDRLYEKAATVLCASEAEGYGLPLIEAASRGAPVVARDIPVFRDVAGDRASFFSGTDPQTLADVLATRLANPHHRDDGHSEQDYPSWKDSGSSLLSILAGDLDPYTYWCPGKRRVLWAHQKSVSGANLQMSSGRLVLGSDGGTLQIKLDISLEAGLYQLRTLDPLGGLRRHFLPEHISAGDGDLLESTSESACRFRLDVPTETLVLRFPDQAGAAVGTIVIERLDAEDTTPALENSHSFITILSGSNP